MSVASGTDVPLPTKLKFWRYANVKDNFFSQDKMRIVKDKLCSEVEVPSKQISTTTSPCRVEIKDRDKPYLSGFNLRCYFIEVTTTSYLLFLCGASLY